MMTMNSSTEMMTTDDFLAMSEADQLEHLWGDVNAQTGYDTMQVDGAESVAGKTLGADGLLIAYNELAPSTGDPTQPAERATTDQRVGFSQEAKKQSDAENGFRKDEAGPALDREQLRSAKDGECCLGDRCGATDKEKIYVPSAFVFANKRCAGVAACNLVAETRATPLEQRLVHGQPRHGCVAKALPALHAAKGCQSVTSHTLFTALGSIVEFAAEAKARLDAAGYAALREELMGIIAESIDTWRETILAEGRALQGVDLLLAWEAACPVANTAANQHKFWGIAKGMNKSTGRVLAELLLYPDAPTDWFGPDLTKLVPHYLLAVSGKACDDAYHAIHYGLLFDKFRGEDGSVPIFTAVPDYECASAAQLAFYDAEQASLYCKASAPSAPRLLEEHHRWLAREESSPPDWAPKEERSEASKRLSVGAKLEKACALYGKAKKTQTEVQKIDGGRGGGMPKEFWDNYIIRNAIRGKMDISKTVLTADGPVCRPGGAVGVATTLKDRIKDLLALRVWTAVRALSTLRAGEGRTFDQLLDEAYVLSGYTVTPPLAPIRFRGVRRVGDRIKGKGPQILTHGFPTSMVDPECGTPRLAEVVAVTAGAAPAMLPPREVAMVTLGRGKRPLAEEKPKKIITQNKKRKVQVAKDAAKHEAALDGKVQRIHEKRAAALEAELEAEMECDE
jgi:hypothetical protein